MIHIVTRENRASFRSELSEMHRQRKRVFVDQMGWRLDCEDGFEIDEFDSADAIYLLHEDAQGQLRASARMLPTEAPHLLGTVFPDLCPGGVPCGPDIWESTRFCPSPEIVDSGARRQLLGVMIAGMIEAALLFGVNHITFVAGGALRPVALKAGWEARALGPIMRRNGDRIAACIAEATPDGLRRVRAQHGLPQPLTRYAAPIRVAA